MNTGIMPLTESHEQSMLIGGVLANSLIDYPGKPAVVLFTQGCQWRCPYCHNSNLIRRRAHNLIDEAMVFDILRSRPPDMRNVVITGGEPTLQPSLIIFLERLQKAGMSVKLDTNGSSPKMLETILRRHLVDYVAMDMKGPLDAYHRFCGQKGYATAVARSIRLLIDSSIPSEFRTTVVPSLHRAEDFAVMGRTLEGGAHLYLQPFRSRSTLHRALQNSAEPTGAFMARCAHFAGEWLPVTIRS